MDFNLERVSRNMTRNLQGSEIIANNLANISTNGYKRDSTFTDWFTEAVKLGSQRRYTEFSQGELIKTDNPTDIGLASDGFFVLETQAGPAYTRDGHFMVSTDGFLQSPHGHRLMGLRGPISVLAEDGTMADVTITRTGEVYLNGIASDQLVLASIPDVHALEKIGSNLFRSLESIVVAEMDPDRVDIRQGMLEASNVRPVREMVDMIEKERNFESSQRVVRAMDTIMGRAIQLSEYR